MRIAILHSRYSNRVPSGENTVVDAEFSALTRGGVRVELFQTDPSVVRARASYPLGAAARVSTGVGRSFADEIKRFGPDVLHVHNVFPDLGERSVAKLPFTKVVTAHNYRWACADGSFYRAGSLCQQCVTGSAFNGVRHGCHKNPIATLPLAVAHRAGIQGNPLVRAAREVWSPSAFHLARLVDAGLPETKGRVTPHFVPDDAIPSSSSRRETFFLFAGRLEPEKGIVELIEHWPADAPRLQIAGAGSLENWVKERAADRNIDVVGQLGHAQLMNTMGRARGLIISSTWWEPFGLVAIEAMAMGLPVISVGEHAASQIVSRHEAGSTAGGFESLGGAITVVLGRSPESWASHLRDQFRSHFSETSWLARRISEYEAVQRM